MSLRELLKLVYYPLLADEHYSSFTPRLTQSCKRNAALAWHRVRQPESGRPHFRAGDLQMGAEDAAHLGSVVVFTVQVVVPRFHAELPLAGADGRGARAVTGEGGCHRDGLHPGFSPESSFTYAKRNDVVTKQEKCPCLSPPLPARLAPCKTTPSGKFLAT